MVGAWKSKVGKTELLDTAKARHLRGVDDELLKLGYFDATVDGVNDGGHDVLNKSEGVLKG